MPTETQLHYNKQNLENEIRNLARRQVVTLEKDMIQPIGPVLNSSKKTLTDTYRTLARAAKENRELSPGAEWVIDNFYIIQEQTVQLKEDLPSSYYRKLPRLTEGEYSGYPRIYELVQKLATVSDNVIDQTNTTSAVQTFQKIHTLKIGELWAVPIMIRLVLIVRLAEKSREVLRQRGVRDFIDNWLDNNFQRDTDEPGYLLLKIIELTEEGHDDKAFLTMLARRLQTIGILTETERSWFDYKFKQWNTTLENELMAEAQQTSKLHLSIQNAISSLRETTETEWSGFVESCSVIERILRLDPSGFYPYMDFKTRDIYRKKIERLSRYSTSTETEVSEKVLSMAERAVQQTDSRDKDNRRHIGYYLIDEGYQKLCNALDYKMPLGEKIFLWAEKHPAGYFFAIGIHVLVLLAIVAVFTGFMMAPEWVVLLTLAVALLPAINMSVVSINRLLTLLLPPRILPKLDLDGSGSIPDEYRTMIVVPTLLYSPEDVREQFEALEIRALANPNDALQFVILGDFTDAPKEEMPGDAELITAGKKIVKQLNRKYQSKYGKKFYLLHRKRCWNDSQKIWMGWERKRGKLEEFNKILMQPEAETSYSTISGDFLETIQKQPVKYVITLDADTKLPPGSAEDLIRTAGHPLNRPQFNKEKNLVERGYGILQPRISIPPKSANKTWFARIFSGNVGLDPYTTVVSDIYQDLFGEGVFIGKGLYDVETFDKILCDLFPSDTVLSHDLLESTYLRTGVLTDIELFDDYPTTYLNYTKRNHRWIRGDWQILKWLFPKVPSAKGKKRNSINIISKWKILDNLRRSLDPAALLIFLLAGWTILPEPAIIWTLAAFGIVAFPIYSSFSTGIFQRPTRVAWELYLEKLRTDIKINTVQAVTTFLFLPHQAYLSIDAILRTLWRVFISKKKLLEWTSASQIERQLGAGLLGYWKMMWINFVWSAICVGAGWFFNPSILFLAIPFGIAWTISPFLAYQLSKEVEAYKKVLKQKDIRELRSYARQTWHYFEQYVNEDHNWLPPDNFQEVPYIGAVGRTSPTNIGLGLTATCAAYNFGYITLKELLYKLGNMLGSMKLLEQYEGHLYNWYATSTRAILNPRYVSTVDSGNLAGCLLVVKQTLEKINEELWPNPAFWDGLTDTLWILRELAERYCSDEQKSEQLQSQIFDLIDDLIHKIPRSTPDEVSNWKRHLDELAPLTEELSKINFDVIKEHVSVIEFQQIKDWYQIPLKQVQGQREEINQFLSIPGRGRVKNRIFKVNDLKNSMPFSEWIARGHELAGWCHSMVQDMNFKILYNKKRRLFSIGYNVDRAAQDKGTYDLLASEARLASFIAIAKGEAPPEHWFQLARRLTTIEKYEILLSWSGSMFEYLMPILFMVRYDRTLLSDTCEHAVVWQHNYGKSMGRPWGFSESGYGVLNLELHYQYRAFGAPGLGLKHGLAEDYVAAPYATMLALMVRPGMAMENLRRLKKEGAYGLNGFYESVDYTSGRGNPGIDKIVVKMYMAHHQGMSLMALANILKGNIFQNLFHNDPLIQACELLLQERIPRGIPTKEPHPIDLELEPGEDQKIVVPVDHCGQDELSDSPPRTHILSNGKLSTIITHSGTGYSRFNDIALTRWRADRVQDLYGFFFYIKDLDSNEFWSMGHQPVGRKADRYDTWFHAGKVQIARVDEWIESFMEVCVSPEDNIELRKITLTNYSEHPRRLELTSYAEVVTNQLETDMAHRAFSNLFLQTEHIPEYHALLAKRRPRSKDDQELWLVHTIASDDINKLPEPLQYDTSRTNFIGRGRSPVDPAALDKDNRLGGIAGNVPDPILSMRRVVELGPGKKKSITFGLGKADSRNEAIVMADRYDNPYATDRVFELASIYGRVELEHIGLTGDQFHYFQKFAGALLYGNERLRAPESTLKKNRRTQSGLWASGISGDVPILVYSISDTNQLRTVERLLKAHALWRHKRFDVDLVIINDHSVSYLEELQQAIHRHIQISMERQKLNERGGVFVLRADDILPEDRILLESVAGAVIHGRLPKLDFSFGKITPDVIYHPLARGEVKKIEKDERPDLLFFNGFGGFSEDGKEYSIHLVTDEPAGRLRFPPAPWINVIANQDFGFITSERGAGYTWSQNSHENRLTSWSNDAVMDPAGEAFYIRDEDLRLFWSPLPGPIPGSSHYEVRHGFGYTTFNSQTINMIQEVTKWVSQKDPVKIIKVRLTNTDLLAHKLSIYWYLDWVLGEHREISSRYVITSLDEQREAVFAQNHYNNEFAGRVAFAAHFSENQKSIKSYTGSRTEFIGRNRTLRNPQSVCCSENLKGKFGGGVDPCAAFQSSIFLESGESIDFYYMLGEAATESEAGSLIDSYRDVNKIESSLREVKDFWIEKLGRIQISTPLQELNILVNGWLQYQNIACRIWARTGFYQSGGAFGFRDQLQDASAALYLDPELSRKQILLHAEHQFIEGDVLHWWHPPSDRGIRSRISDDLLWLPYVTAFYIKKTGDRAILNEEIKFLSARKLEDDEDEAYLQPEDSGQIDSLYEHCCRAIDRSLTKGPHGLPLIGTGDWNDGMNQVGEQGKGESVWLGFFLYHILQEFIPLCKRKQDWNRIDTYSSYRKELKEHLNSEGWDGEWYRRAYFDEGMPLGSQQNEECKIDAIAQAWAVLSKAAPAQKAGKALNSAEKWLVSEDNGFIRLLTPPFDRIQLNPGYIKGYIPGVRENGGQYTHGALWLIMAFAEMGYKDKAVQYLRMLTPIRHSASKHEAEKYKVEPYAVVADIYGEPPLTGMGGWTWYTGSAGWMYRVIVEAILGIEISEGDRVQIRPFMSDDWDQYTIRIKDQSRTTEYVIGVENSERLDFGKLAWTIDGDEMKIGKNPTFNLKPDGKVHHIKVEINPI